MMESHKKKCKIIKGKFIKIIYMIIISMEILRQYCKLGLWLLAAESNEIQSASIQNYECDSKVIRGIESNCFWLEMSSMIGF